jgi:hypothetical protein
MSSEGQIVPHTRVECPVWHRPLFHIVAGGLEIQCRSCRVVHSISREKLEQVWEELNGVSATPSLTALACNLQMP